MILAIIVLTIIAAIVLPIVLLIIFEQRERT